MTPEQVNERLKALDKERNELLKIIESKPTPEERFLGLIQGLQIMLYSEYPDSIFFFKEPYCLAELNLKNKKIWFKYLGFWSVFGKEFGLNYRDIQQLLNNLLEKHLKLIGFTPRAGMLSTAVRLEKHLKLIGFTPIN